MMFNIEVIIVLNFIALNAYGGNSTLAP